MSDERIAYVHIGLGKTGTSTVQTALDEQAEQLADLGIEVPGRGHRDARRAVYDLMGRRIGGSSADERARTTGAWDRYAAALAASPTPAVVMSEEMLALARPRQVRRLVESLAPRRVVVLVTVRDLGRVVGSFWQQMVMMGRTETLSEFAAAVRDPAEGKASAGVGFWMRQDLGRVLAAWETAVPRADIRVITLPGPGQPPTALNDRFAEAIGAPAGLLVASRATDNSSVGVAQAEVVRRFNEHANVEENHRLKLMKVIRRGLADPAATPIAVPASEHDWIAERAASDIAMLRDGGYRVIGSLDDLVPRPGPEVDAAVGDAEVAAAAMAALTAVAEDHGRLFTRLRRVRRRLRRATGTDAAEPAPTKLAAAASRGRVAAFEAKTSALKAADRNPVLARMARVYLDRTSRR